MRDVSREHAAPDQGRGAQRPWQRDPETAGAKWLLLSDASLAAVLSKLRPTIGFVCVLVQVQSPRDYVGVGTHCELRHAQFSETEMF